MKTTYTQTEFSFIPTMKTSKNKPKQIVESVDNIIEYINETLEWAGDQTISVIEEIKDKMIKLKKDISSE